MSQDQIKSKNMQRHSVELSESELVPSWGNWPVTRKWPCFLT